MMLRAMPLGAALWAAFSWPVMAQSCAPRADMLAALARLGEVPVARAVADVGGVIERFENPDTGSWTITLALADGRACAIVSGRSWQGLASGGVKGPRV